MLPSKAGIKFQMIQNYRQKLKVLKLNLIQSQRLNQTLKQELLKIGQQSNSLIIQISTKANRVTELKSINPQKQKELYYAREQLKRIQYKTEKHQIKLKEYEDRLKKFKDMYQIKIDKNSTLQDKIHKLQTKLKQQRDRQTQLFNELKFLQPKNEPTNKLSLKIQSQYLKSISKLSNPIDDIEIQILNTSTKIKRISQQQQDLKRKNNQLKSNINKLQQNIQSIQQFMNNSSYIPDFIERNQKSGRESEVEQYKTSRSCNLNEEYQQRILKYSDKFDLTLQPSAVRKEQRNVDKKDKIQDRIRKPLNLLPSQIAYSVSRFQNLKSKSMLDPLVRKHTQISEKQNDIMDRLKQNFQMMNELTQINSILESQICQENSKLSAFNIKNKKYTQLQQRTQL